MGEVAGCEDLAGGVKATTAPRGRRGIFGFFYLHALLGGGEQGSLDIYRFGLSGCPSAFLAVEGRKKQGKPYRGRMFLRFPPYPPPVALL